MSPAGDGPAPASDGSGADGAALVRVGWTAGRAEPDHRSEMVTQWLCGEALRIASSEAGGAWLRVRGPDGYRCWVAAGGVVRTDAARAGRWIEAADHVSLGVRLEAGDGSPVPRHLPWGARVSYDRDDGLVGLPDGATARARAPARLVAVERLEERFPARPESLAETALAWRGAPYLWGGRTPDGVDCSGLAQAVSRVHGVELPRDSGDQLEATREARVSGSGADGGGGVARAPSVSAAQVGDLLFFRGAGGAITHVAVSLGGGEVVHAVSGRGAVAVDDLTAPEPLCRELAGRLVAVTRPLSLRG